MNKKRTTGFKIKSRGETNVEGNLSYGHDDGFDINIDSGTVIENKADSKSHLTDRWYSVNKLWRPLMISILAAVIVAVGHHFVQRNNQKNNKPQSIEPPTAQEESLQN